MTDTETVRAGLIGCGDISPSHLKSYANCGIELGALCDTDLDRAEARREEFGSKDTLLFDDYNDLLEREEIDFVTVATPVAAHVPITVDTLRAGKHVICEKPSALSLEENERVIKEAEKADRKVAFCSARMRWGYATLAREYINVGALGDIYRIDVRYYRRRGRPGVDIIQDAPWFVSSELAGGGIVMDMGQYFMDMVLDLAGWPEITSVAGDTYRGHHHDLPEEVPFDVEEHCTFLARTAGQLTFSFDLAWIAHSEPLRQVSILGTEGGIRMTRDKPFAFYADKGGPWRWMETTTDWKDSTGGNDHIYQRLIRAIRGEEVSIGTSPKQALALTEMTRMALTSAAEKREVTREQLRE